MRQRLYFDTQVGNQSREGQGIDFQEDTATGQVLHQGRSAVGSIQRGEEILVHHHGLHFGLIVAEFRELQTLPGLPYDHQRGGTHLGIDLIPQILSGGGAPQGVHAGPVPGVQFGQDLVPISLGHLAVRQDQGAQHVPVDGFGGTYCALLGNGDFALQVVQNGLLTVTGQFFIEGERAFGRRTGCNENTFYHYLGIGISLRFTEPLNKVRDSFTVLLEGRVEI